MGADEGGCGDGEEEGGFEVKGARGEEEGERKYIQKLRKDRWAAGLI